MNKLTATYVVKISGFVKVFRKVSVTSRMLCIRGWVGGRGGEGGWV